MKTTKFSTAVKTGLAGAVLMALSLWCTNVSAAPAVGASSSVSAPMTGASMDASAPTTGESSASAVKSANPPKLTTLGLMKLADGPATATIIPVLGPTPSSPSWVAFATKLVTDAKNGTINMVAHDVTSPTDYTVCNGKIMPYNLVYSLGTPLWKDQLNPSAPFQNERGQVVSQLVQVDSASGGDTLPLSMIIMRSASSDAGSILGDSLIFVNMDYTALAFGIKADGSVVAIGSGDQKVAKIILITTMKLFNGGATQSGLSGATDWISSKGNFALTYSVSFNGYAGSYGTTSVSLTGYRNAQPTMLITPTSISLTNNEAGRVYPILSSTNVSGPWLLFGFISDLKTLTITNTAEQARFFRVKAQ